VTVKELLSEIWALLQEWWGWKRSQLRQTCQRRQQPWELPLARLSRRIDELESLRTQVSRLEGEQTFVRKLVSDRELIDSGWRRDYITGELVRETDGSE